MLSFLFFVVDYYASLFLSILQHALILISNLSCSRAKTVNENLKMNAALLSRFDLVFILLDKPDELLDKRLSEHIMSVSSAVYALWYMSMIHWIVSWYWMLANQGCFCMRVFDKLSTKKFLI